ncbi:MAG: heme exporter protein CcmD [Dongiaceae bacterium]
MNDLQTYFAMDGYGGFIWPSYLATAVILVALTIASVLRLRRLRRDLAQFESERESAR